MSLKSNMAYAGKELSGDEKMLENTLKLEAFYKKYKKIIWLAVAIVVAIFIIKPIVASFEEMKLESANKALLVLQKDPKNSQAMETLKSENPSLYELYSYSQAVKAKDKKALSELANSKNRIIADISNYHSKVLASKSSDSLYYKEMSMVEDAFIAIKAGKVKEAREKLELVDARSPVAPIAELLKHYTIKGK